MRNKTKIINFSALYGISKDTLARNANMKVKEAQKLLDIYWKRNFAVKQFVKSCITKEAGGKTWVLNPISGFWLSLRTERDIFSTVNQSSAVFVFDTWLKNIREQKIEVALQYHDEILFNVLDGHKEITRAKIKKAMDLTNNKLKLNITAGCSVEFGDNYSSCH